MSDLHIKSSIKNYKVYFKNSFSNVILDLIQENDVVLVDNKLFSKLGSVAKTVINSNSHILIEASEENKSYLFLENIIKKIIKNNFRKNNKLIAIGGGITQDITAFIASILFRGVDWYFFPTTLLAQADSCIGGKTSINIGEYKNQLGNFYPPSKIYIIPKLLNTLPRMDFQSGMGEMLHFYLVSGNDDYLFYKKRYEDAFKNENILMSLIRRNLEIKKHFIEIDEFDKNERLLLNYGHSFGHALESITDYSIPHGIAVSYGMDIANFISLRYGFLSNDIFTEIHKQLEKIYKEHKIRNINIEKFEEALSKDKKNIGNTYRLILSRGIGQMFIHSVKPSLKFTTFIKEYFNTIK